MLHFTRECFDGEQYSTAFEMVDEKDSSCRLKHCAELGLEDIKVWLEAVEVLQRTLNMCGNNLRPVC